MAARLGSARSLAMGQYVCFGQGAEALATNPAMLSATDRWGGYLQAQERYGTGAFRTVWAGAFFPVWQRQMIGLSAGRFGDAVFSEQWLTVAYRHESGPVRLAIFPQLFQFQALGAATRWVPTLNFGAVTQVSQLVALAARVTNLTQSSLPEQAGWALGSEVAIGVSYRPLAQVETLTELNKRIDGPLDAKLGLEYQPVRSFALRLGAVPTRRVFTAGFALAARRILFEYGVEMGAPVGWVHQAGIRTQIEASQKR